MADRISRDEMLMLVAEVVALRGTCPRAHVGAVLALEGRIISTGYNGSPSGTPHCLEAGCIVVDDHCVRSSHAEAGAIAFAARKGLSIEGATLYITHTPCSTCAKLALNAGIARVIIRNHYQSGVSGHRDGLTELEDAKVPVSFLPRPGYNGLDSEEVR